MLQCTQVTRAGEGVPASIIKERGEYRAFIFVRGRRAGKAFRTQRKAEPARNAAAIAPITGQGVVMAIDMATGSRLQGQGERRHAHFQWNRIVSLAQNFSRMNRVCPSSA